MRLATNLLQFIECSFTLQQIRLHFLVFELEDCSDCVCDSVDIADVDGRTTPVMSSFCGSAIPNDIFTIYNRVLVNFRTDGFTSHYGFRIYYSTIIPVQGCRGSPVTIQGPKGTIGINETYYDNYMTCGWKIQVEATKRVQLHFLSFELEASTDCSFDSVNIYDGHDTSAPLLQTSCGHTVPGDIASSGDTMFVRFKTDHSGTYGGFSVYYSAFIPVDGCLGTPVEMRGSKGTFGISEDQYHNDMRCSWKIQVDPFKRVRLNFLSFHLQESTDCSYDSIKIYDGKDTNASMVRTVCGTTVPEDITSSTHTLFVHFSSGDTSTYSAFQIYYSDFVDPGGCHGSAITMRGPMGNFGVTKVQYSNYMRCNWNIQVNSSDIVKLKFVEFSVESCCDSVTVYDGDSRSAPLLGTFRGNTLPRDVFSTNNTMLVHFESDGSGTWNGFEINYKSLPLATGQCESGLQLDEVRDECVLCPRGFFRQKGRHFDCQSCPSHLTTPGRGSRSVSDCSQGNCTVGQMIAGTTCVNCPVGTYQDKILQTMCIPCGNNMTTLRESAASIMECMPNCQPGEMSDGQLCTKCPRGTYQPDRWMTACIDCPRDFTTRDVGSISIADCKWQCESGFQLDEVKDKCVLCPRGFFKEKGRHFDCQSCPSHLTTPGRGSRSASDCSHGQCESGFQLDEVRDECVLCPRGFFKDKALHDDCQSCPSHLTTPGRGSRSASDCSQGNCTAGQRIVGTTCEDCSVGSYQDKIWQTMCIPCGDSMTTLREGATSITECMLDCQPGEMSDGRLCTKCPRGTYQPDSRMTACIDCPLNFTTRDIGSANIVDCKCGYEDDKCNYTRSDMQSDNPSTAHNSGAYFGGCVLLLLSMTGFAICYRRRRRDSCSETALITTTQQDVGECNETCQVHDTGV
ncbi:Cubilin [Lamellibrachia satsuma]|nr:Cubilin [Lamellibrachia satsuma]